MTVSVMPTTRLGFMLSASLHSLLACGGLAAGRFACYSFSTVLRNTKGR